MKVIVPQIQKGSDTVNKNSKHQKHRLSVFTFTVTQSQLLKTGCVNVYSVYKKKHDVCLPLYSDPQAEVSGKARLQQV